MIARLRISFCLPNKLVRQGAAFLINFMMRTEGNSIERMLIGSRQKVG